MSDVGKRTQTLLDYPKIKAHMERLYKEARSEGEGNVNLAVDNAERRERELLRKHVVSLRSGLQAALDHANGLDNPTRSQVNGAIQAYSQVLKFLDARETNTVKHARRRQ